MSGARQVVIEYGSWATDDSGFHLNGVHDIHQDEREFRCVFDVVVVGASDAACRTAVGTMIDALNTRHLTFSITVGAEVYYKFVDGVDGAPAANAEGAEFIQASWALLGTHRTTKTRAYRITVNVTRSASQPGKLGVLDQAITLMTRPNGQRLLSFRAQFTPGPSNSESGTAQARHDDATYGFDALTDALTTALTGTWERTGIKGTQYEEDSRTLTAWSTFTELLYDQSLTGRDDPALTNTRYDISVDHRSGPGIPEFQTARPFTGVGVSFTSQVDKDWLDASPNNTIKSAIRDKVLPYIRGTVAKDLLLGSSDVILLRHSLKADPANSRVAGQVLFLVVESQVLEISKRTKDQGFMGDVYVPKLTGKKWDRMKHTGPGNWSRTVAIGAKVIGEDPGDTLQAIEDSETALQDALGFKFIGWGVASTPIVERFWEAGGGQITTTVQARELFFTRADLGGDSANSLTGRGPNGHHERGVR